MASLKNEVLWLGVLVILFAAGLVFGSKLFSISSPHRSEQAGDYSLYVAECSTPRVSCIVRYPFKNGTLQPKKILPSFSLTSVGFDEGGRVVDNRFLVPRDGEGAYDTKIGKFLWYKELNEEEFHSIVDSDPRPKIYTDSPDHKKSAISTAEGIYLHGKDGNKDKVIASGLSFQAGGARYEIVMEVPFLWLDNDRILTQEKNGKLVVVHSSDQESRHELIVDIPNMGHSFDPPKLSIAPNGTIYYSISLDNLETKYFRIDVEGKKYEPLTYLPIGNEFEIQIPEVNHDQDIRYRGESIISCLCGLEAKTVDGYIAAVGGPGVVVWNRISGQSTRIKTESNTKLIGWIKD
jgi:hypothetical protein